MQSQLFAMIRANCYKYVRTHVWLTSRCEILHSVLSNAIAASNKSDYFFFRKDTESKKYARVIVWYDSMTTYALVWLIFEDVYKFIVVFLLFFLHSKYCFINYMMFLSSFYLNNDTCTISKKQLWQKKKNETHFDKRKRKFLSSSSTNNSITAIPRAPRARSDTILSTTYITTLTS